MPAAVNCRNCGEKNPPSASNKPRVYCSKDCSDKYYGIRQTPIVVNCKNCGEKNPPTAKKRRVYCSKECWSAFRRKGGGGFTSQAREGYGDASRKTKRERQERKEDYEATIAAGWINYLDLAEEYGYDRSKMHSRIRVALNENDSKLIHDGAPGAKGQKRLYISPEGVRKLAEYDKVIEEKAEEVRLKKLIRQKDGGLAEREAKALWAREYWARKQSKDPVYLEKRKAYRAEYYSRPETKEKHRLKRIVDKYGSEELYLEYKERKEKEVKARAKARAKAKAEEKERKRLAREEKKEQTKIRYENYIKSPEWRAQVAAKRREERKDPVVKLRTGIGVNVRHALKRHLVGSKGGKTFARFDFTPDELFEHLELRFDEHMTWENYGTYWSLDHIIPQSATPWDSVEHPNFKKSWALDNLQPLPNHENAVKGNIYEGRRHLYDGSERQILSAPYVPQNNPETKEE